MTQPHISSHFISFLSSYHFSFLNQVATDETIRPAQSRHPSHTGSYPPGSAFPITQSQNSQESSISFTITYQSTILIATMQFISLSTISILNSSHFTILFITIHNISQHNNSIHISSITIATQLTNSTLYHNSINISTNYNCNHFHNPSHLSHSFQINNNQFSIQLITIQKHNLIHQSTTFSIH